jgi:hypothetical protein
MYYVQSPSISRNSAQRIKSPNPPSGPVIKSQVQEVKVSQMQIPRQPAPMFKSGHSMVSDTEIKKLQVD